LKNGAQLISNDVDSAGNLWLALAGTVDSDGPVVQEWKQAMADHRQEVENDPKYP